MASLNDSLRLKASGTKAPATVGADPLVKPDVKVGGGQSGGIAKAKQIKNAGSTPVDSTGPSSRFTKSIGGGSQSDKTVGYF